MTLINVPKPFKLNLADGLHDFEVGPQEVSDEIAAHWYVAAHSEQMTLKPAKADADGKAKAEADAKVKADTEEKAKADAEVKAKAKANADAKAKA